MGQLGLSLKVSLVSLGVIVRVSAVCPECDEQVLFKKGLPTGHQRLASQIFKASSGCMRSRSYIYCFILSPPL